MAERQAFVFMHLAGGPVPAGRLTMLEDGRVSHAIFEYGARYLQRPDRVPVDPVTLPLPEPDAASVRYRTAEGFAVFNGIRDAAPDGWGRLLMTKAAGDRHMAEFDYLVASGDRRVGALAFGPTPERPARQAPWGDADAPGEHFDLATLLEASLRAQEVDQLDDNLRQLLTAGSSMGGARPKAATDIDGEAWIAKFPDRADVYPASKVEFATMRLAARCGLNVPALDLQTVLGRDIYLIKRFDRHMLDGRERRIPFASGLTMLAAHEMEVARYGYADLAAALRQYGSKPRQDLAELFARMVFNILVTNDDDHLRNHGFLYDGADWRLSPLYDVVPKPQVGLDRRLMLAVGPDGRAATLANALAGAAQFGVSEEQARAVIERLRGQVATHWRRCFVEAGVGQADIGRFATCFRLAEAE
jgi:serine/threonine-protein kinase HipA